MKDNLDKLKGHSDTKQDINRRQNNDVNGKDSNKLNKRINDIQKVITDPDVWNVNIASRDRLDRLETEVKEIKDKQDQILKAMDRTHKAMERMSKPNRINKPPKELFL